VKVTLIGRTAFNSEVAHNLTGWEGTANDPDGSLLTEFAGRACYQSWKKPNLATSTNPKYLQHILEVDHTSTFEHGTFTFYIEEVSRSLTHELIRHRHLSPSQESQRFVKLAASVKPIIPPLYYSLGWITDDNDPQASEVQGILDRAWREALRAYDELVEIAEERLYRDGVTGTALKKESREAARCVLPNMTPTRIVMTGNHRAWRHFLKMRGALAADAEIRQLALQILEWAQVVEPALYQDLIVDIDARGRQFITVAMDGL
jgi:thymidylate synthase (FAD)